MKGIHLYILYQYMTCLSYHIQRSLFWVAVLE